jgi:deazaflavin-dependent oxidoreductase (nitroreductase family)
MPLYGDHELSPRGWVRDHTEKIVKTGTTDSVDVMGLPVILVTTRGARSGKLRKVPLMRVEHNGVYAVVASDGGAAKAPAWVHNVAADPLVEVQDGTVMGDYTAREVSGGERDIWWQRAVATFPRYQEYQTKIDRQIAVFVLEPFAAHPDGTSANV